MCHVVFLLAAFSSMGKFEGSLDSSAAEWQRKRARMYKNENRHNKLEINMKIDKS